MYITWLGQSCFKIQSGEVTLITDPVGKENGLRAPRFSNVNIITVSRKESDLSKIKSEALVIDKPGEYEVKRIFLQGIPVRQKQGKETVVVYWMEIENMTLGPGVTEHPSGRRGNGKIGRVRHLVYSGRRECRA